MPTIHQPRVHPYISPATLRLWAELHPARLAVLHCRCAEEKQPLRARIAALAAAIRHAADEDRGVTQ